MPITNGQCRSTRKSHPATRLQDFYPYHVNSFPIQDDLTYKNVYEAFPSSPSNKPNIFHKAFNQIVWKEAMREELLALDKNHTWDIVR